MTSDEYKSMIHQMTDEEVLDLLEFVSNEVKKRNTLVSPDAIPTSDTIQYLVNTLFPSIIKR